mgnify:FL=1
MNRGIGQNLDTCWFYSSLNIFLLSDNGLKVFWKKLKEVYEGMNANQKAFFNSNINTPCPLTFGNKSTMIYFWKFMDEYICALKGPGRLHSTAYRSKNLLKNMPFNTNALREAKGLAPGVAQREIKTVLSSIGFTSDEVRYASASEYPVNTWTQPIIIRMFNKGNTSRYMWARNAPNWSSAGYILTGASMYVSAEGRRPHQFACVIQDGKKYIFDSNQAPVGLHPCNWTNQIELKEWVQKHYQGKEIKWILWSFLVYTRKDYTNKISPSCVRKYAVMSEANKQWTKERQGTAPYIFSASMRGKNVRLAGALPPRMMAHMLQEWGKKPVMNKALFNSLLNASTSWYGALNNLHRLENAGYRYNREGNNYRNFKAKLLQKFPRPPPKYLVNSVFSMIRNNKFKNKNEALNWFEKQIINRNFTLNKNSRLWKNVASGAARVFSTRSKSVKANKTGNNKK